MSRRPYAIRAAERQAEAAALADFYSDDGAGLLIVAGTERCTLCRRDVCSSADYCHGCGCFICAQCDKPKPDDRPQGGPHKPEDHLPRAKVVS